MPVGQTEEDVGSRNAQQRKQNDRAASDAVGNAPPDRRKNELRQRVRRRKQRPDDSGMRVVLKAMTDTSLDVLRQVRNENTESQQIDKHRDRQQQHGTKIGIACRTR